MERYAHLASLVERLLDDKLSLEELHELQQLFRSAKAEGEVKLWLAELWKSSGRYDNQTIDSDYIFKQLCQKIGIQEQLYPVERAKSKRVVRFFGTFVRYAAVILLTLSFAWYWFGKEQPEVIQQVEPQLPVGNNEVSVTYGSKTRIVLPDGSVALLNSGSQLTYPPVFDSERHVTLTGEGYFIVRSDSLHPFFVHAADVSIKALGTEFNVKAYPEEGSVETVLVSGLVEVLKKGQEEPVIELKPGEKASFIKTGTTSQPAVAGTAKEQRRVKVNIDPKPDVSTGWVKNQLVFDAEPFEQIAVRLERWFNVEVDIRNAALRKVHITGRYDTENIEQVMHSLQVATQFTYTIEKNKIIIR